MPEVVIYTTQWCGYCRAAKELLKQLGLEYREIDIEGDAALRREMLQKAQGRHTVPQIFIDGHGIGGYTDLYRLVTENRQNSPN